MTISIMTFSLMTFSIAKLNIKMRHSAYETQRKGSVVMLNVNYAECHKLALFAECHYAECRHAECRGAHQEY
jgi:hypothetical protein